MKWRCEKCQTVYPHYAKAQRCADSHRGGRIECVTEKTQAEKTQGVSESKR